MEPWRRRPLLLALLALACTADEPLTSVPVPVRSGPESTGPEAPNVLLVLLDDVGPESVEAFGIHEEPARTPNLDRLVAEGMRFPRAYAAPVCSPGRAALLTGRHGRRYGVSHNLRYHDDPGSLPLAEVTIAEVVHETMHGRYTTAAFGKWHLVTQTVADPLYHPNDQGFDHFDGTIGNPAFPVDDVDDRAHDYFHWERLQNGELSHEDGYILSATVDRVLDHVATMPEPWFLYVPIHSAHGPNHVPPDALHSVDAGDDRPDPVVFSAMVEAADTELGRLLDGMGPEVLEHTTVIVVGDNGAWADNIPDPWAAEGKGSMTEAGLRVPFVVWSSEVAEPGSASDVPVHLVDVLPTIAELVGASTEDLTLDGRSVVPLLRGDTDWDREAVYAELAGPPGSDPYLWGDRRALMSRTHKVLYNARWDTWSAYTLGDSAADESEDLSNSVDLTDDDIAAFEGLRSELELLTQQVVRETPSDELP